MLEVSKNYLPDGHNSEHITSTVHTNYRIAKINILRPVSDTVQ
jgi:hypothetical protein